MADAILFNLDGSVTVPLTKGHSTTLDREDYETFFRPIDGLPTVPWYALVERSGPIYAARSETLPARRMRWLHREICAAPPGMDVDHIDGDGLNNRRINLRHATRSQNLANRPKFKGASRFKGVTWDKARQLWAAEARGNGVRLRLGRFACEEDAALAYNEAAARLWGEFAKLNEVTRR